jgi:hypothetical protein
MMVVAPPLGRGLLALPVGADGRCRRRVGTVDWLRVLELMRSGQPAFRVPGHTFVTPRWG